MYIIGVAIGILIGLISGAVALVLLRTANTASINDSSSLVAITAELLAIPTFWFGGPWIATDVLKLVKMENIINPYIVALATTFIIIVIYPIRRLIIQMAKELGEGVN